MYLRHFLFNSNVKNSKAWIDISNLNAKPPIVNKSIYMKVLELPSDGLSKIHNNRTFSNRNSE